NRAELIGFRLAIFLHDGTEELVCRSPFVGTLGQSRGSAIRRQMMHASLVLLIGGAAMVWAGSATAQEVDWAKVDAALGRKAAVSGDVHRYGFLRTDLA